MSSVPVSSIYSSIKRNFEAETGEKIADDGDLGIRMHVIAGEVCTLLERAEYCLKQAFPHTATGEYLEKHASTRGMYKKHATASIGEVKFSRKQASTKDIIIPTGTLLAASGQANMMYETTEDATLLKNTLSVIAKAQATAVGKTTNLQAGKIDTIVEGISGIDTVTNPQSFAGGMDEEGDEALRKRLLDSFLNTSNGANFKFYEDFAKSFNQVWSAKALLSSDGSNTLNLYITDIFRSVPTSLINAVKEAIEEVKELNFRINVLKPLVIKQDIEATIYVRHLQNQSYQIGEAIRFIDTEIHQLGIGESLNPYTLAKNLDTVIDGFGSIVFTKPSTLVPVGRNQILMPGLIQIKLEKA